MTASSTSPAPLRLLAVHAHPDDESSKGAATMAMYAAAGVDVMVATCTDGSRGDIQNPAVEGEPHPKRDMAGARRLEMDRAARSWASGSVGWASWTRAFLKAIPFRRFRQGPSPRCRCSTPLHPLVRLVRRFKPHVILSYDENGGYPHPDHIMAHKVAVEAFDAAGDPERIPTRGSLGRPESSTTTAPSARNGSVRCILRSKKPGCSPRMPSGWLRGWSPTRKGTLRRRPRIPPPPRWIAGTSSKRATTPCAPTGHRWTPWGSSSRFHRICSAGPGRGRTTPDHSPGCPPNCPERDLFAGLR